jgi:hypothetical protein
VAYTFPELFQDISNPGEGNEYQVPFTLVVTQEDGRTAWVGNGNLPQDPEHPGPAYLHLSLDPQELVVGGPLDPVSSGRPANTFFSDRDLFDYKQADESRLTITGAGSDVDVTVASITYGFEYTVHLELPADPATEGKIYQGFGPTIGNGSGRGIHLLSFNDRTHLTDPELTPVRMSAQKPTKP